LEPPVKYPSAADPNLVGTYPALSKSGGGFVWDAVLEYRVWCHPKTGDDYFCAFANHSEALEFSMRTPGAEEPIALVLQEEHIAEPQAGQYQHIRERRITEWPVTFLSRPRRTPTTISAFLAPDAPSNRLDILRGITGGSSNDA
jgi:hypothetical protein